MKDTAEAIDFFKRVRLKYGRSTVEYGERMVIVTLKCVISMVRYGNFFLAPTVHHRVPLSYTYISYQLSEELLDTFICRYLGHNHIDCLHMARSFNTKYWCE